MYVVSVDELIGVSIYFVFATIKHFCLVINLQCVMGNTLAFIQGNNH